MAVGHKISAPASLVEVASHVTGIERRNIQMFIDSRSGNQSILLEMLSKAREPAKFGSGQGLKRGEIPHPFDFTKALQLRVANEHHSACLDAKVNATVGLGFKFDSKQAPKKASIQKAPAAAPAAGVQQNVLPEEKPGNAERLLSKADVVLDPLCLHSFQDVLSSVAEDFYATGNGYMEVVRVKKGGKIVGIHRCPAATVQVFVEDNRVDYHFRVTPNDSWDTPGAKRFGRFGDGKKMMTRMAYNPKGTTYSEIIHFRKPNALNRWYGFPDYMACVPSIELIQCLVQYKYDFFNNRGVPEFMLFILGQKLDPKDWTKIETALKGSIGLGNTHKSAALNLSNPNIKVQLEKLAMEASGEETFATTRADLGLSVVTAHGVPPLLAGIQVPGKLGGTNELPNALMAFQALKIGPVQRIFMQTLGKTLASEDAGLGLTLTDMEFYTILDEIDLNVASTVGGMKTPLASANAQGRDPKAGLKD